ncbi:SIMPL domain-containing protein [Candidatus Micrarchaeota archaeon]|nr:SIMPL domain-containing protein [Candidatus Micrarchaeota archaeon]
MIDVPKAAILAALLIALGLFGGAYVLSTASSSPAPNVYVSSVPPDHVLSVSGSSSKKVAPDLLLINLRVQTQDLLAKDSQSENARVMAQLKSKLKSLGLADSDIKSASYSVMPAYDSIYNCPRPSGGMMPSDPSYSNGCKWDSVIRGYITVHSLEVSVKDLTKGGDVIDGASTAGVNQTFVDSIYFTLQDETRNRVQSELLRDASVMAKSKAQNMASGLGVSVGKVLSASESYNSPMPYAYYSRGAMAESVAAPSVPTSVSGGEIEVSASVSVGYATS